jgi:hypothetical protein
MPHNWQQYELGTHGVSLWKCRNCGSESLDIEEPPDIRRIAVDIRLPDFFPPRSCEEIMAAVIQDL